MFCFGPLGPYPSPNDWSDFFESQAGFGGEKIKAESRHMAHLFKPFIALLMFAGLAACGDNDVSRGATGAAAGAVLADVTHNNVLMGVGFVVFAILFVL